MLEYAAADTHYLLELRDILRGKLENMGRLHWAEEEFALLEQVQWTEPEDGAEPAWLRMKGARALKPRQLAVLREVFEWRDGLARRLDRAAFRIMNNEPILAIAREQPKTAEELSRIPGIGRDGLERRGAEILAAVRKGLEVPDADLPRLERQPRRAADPEFDARVERLKAVRNQEAERLALAPGVLCPNGTLEGIARREPKTLVDLRTVPFIRGWQVEAIGDALLAAVRTP
jgi:ribonuclease D